MRTRRAAKGMVVNTPGNRRRIRRTAVLVLALAAGVAASAEPRQKDSPKAVPEPIAPIRAPFDMPQLSRPSFPDRVFDVTDYGAVGDGRRKNTKAIAVAISACAQAGGGVVLLPEGRWLSGAIHLRSNVNLHLKEGAVLVFSTDPNDYLPAVFVRWAGFECYNYSPLIYARDCENIAVTGGGTIDGNGRLWWDWVRKQDGAAHVLYDMVKKEVPVDKRVFASTSLPMRPQLIHTVNCRNVLLEGLTIRSGPFWTVQVTYGENVLVRKLTIRTEGPNNDGINADSCRNMVIEDCDLSTGDDAIAIKSGLNEDGWRVNRPSENIVIRRCRAHGGHTGVAIGSDMSGNVRNVYVRDCDFSNVWRGVWIKSTRGRGGCVEDVHVSHTTIRQTYLEALGITTAYSAWFGSTTGKAPRIRNVRFENIHIPYAHSPVSFQGLEEAPLENIIIHNSLIVSTGHSRYRYVHGLTLKEVELASYVGEAVTEFWDCRNVLFDGVRASGGARYLFSLHGERSAAFRLAGVSLPAGMEPIRMDAGIARSVLTIR